MQCPRVCLYNPFRATHASQKNHRRRSKDREREETPNMLPGKPQEKMPTMREESGERGPKAV